MERFILQPADRKEAEKAMALIDEAKEFLKSQGIDQWQTGYPDMETIIGDLAHGRGYFIGEGSSAAAYLCIDFAGERPMKRAGQLEKRSSLCGSPPYGNIRGLPGAWYSKYCVSAH